MHLLYSRDLFIYVSSVSLITTFGSLLGTPTINELQALSVVLATLPPNSNTRSGRALRIKFMDMLSIPILKLDLVESVGITASSPDDEIQKFHKLFDEWLCTKEDTTRITLLRALISEVEEIIPQPLKDSYDKGINTKFYNSIQVVHF